MDPNACLATLRQLAAKVAANTTDPDADELAEVFQNLDGWLSTGGFLPAAWHPAERRERIQREATSSGGGS